MSTPSASTDVGRRETVLVSAMDTFARTGYRGTSMDAVARAAHISRPGLYFLFASKEQLFREAAAYVVAQDLAAIDDLLADRDRPLRHRLLDAFDRWAGRYVGPGARDVPAVVAEHPDLVDDSVRAAPARFEALLTAAVAAGTSGSTARPVAQTLISTSIGLQHQVDSRADHRRRMRSAIEVVLGPGGGAPGA